MGNGYELTGPLETERLGLRAFEPGDLDAVFATQSNPEAARHVYWEARTEDEVRAALEKKIAGVALRAGGDVLFWPRCSSRPASWSTTSCCSG